MRKPCRNVRFAQHAQHSHSEAVPSSRKPNRLLLTVIHRLHQSIAGSPLGWLSPDWSRPAEVGRYALKLVMRSSTL